MSIPKRRKKAGQKDRQAGGTDPVAVADALAAEANALAGPDGEVRTLLCPKDKLPPNTLDGRGRKNTLQELVLYRPDAYRKMIGLLALRVGQAVAAEYVNVAAWTFAGWMNKGMQDIAAQIDTFDARLVYDVRKAIAYARAKSEIEVGHMDPLIYLQRGAGRALGDEWRDDPKNPTQPLQKPSARFRIGSDGTYLPDIDPLSLPAPDGSEKPEEDIEEADFTVTQVSPNRMQEALSVLQQAGIIQMTPEIAEKLAQSQTASPQEPPNAPSENPPNPQSDSPQEAP